MASTSADSSRSALYTKQNQSSARALKAVPGLELAVGRPQQNVANAVSAVISLLYRGRHQLRHAVCSLLAASRQHASRCLSWGHLSVLHRPWWPTWKMAAPEGRSGTKHRHELVAARCDDSCGISISRPSKKPLRQVHRPPQTLQNSRQQQQQELAVLDENLLPITVYKAAAAFDGDGPIDPPVRRIRRTPARARRRPAPPHVYRQQLYLHPEDVQFDHSYTWTRNSGGPEATVSATRCHASAAAGIVVTHVGPPRRASRFMRTNFDVSQLLSPRCPLGRRSEELH